MPDPDTPPADDAPSPGRDSSDAADGDAAAQAEREEALRILLATPDDDAPRVRLAVPTIDGPLALSHEISLPVIPSAARVASAPWTFVEVGLGLLVVILTGALALLAGNEFRARARAERGATELAALAAAFESYHREAGKWPDAAPARGAVPVGMEKLLAADAWSRPTPLGGHYAWVKSARKNPPALAITAFVPDAPLASLRDELQRIDRLLDDGVLETGRFRTGFNGWPIYFLAGEN